MANIYGIPGHDISARSSARHKDLAQRFGIPLLCLVLLGAAGIFSFWKIHVIVAAFFAIFFVAVTLKFEDLGLMFTRHVEQDDARAQAQKDVAQALTELPDEYHVFHGVIFQKQYVDHVVLGPNGLFLISSKSQTGKITLAKETLRLDDKRFMHDMVQRCWLQAQGLTRQLGLQYVAGALMTPVICFNRAKVEILRPVRGVFIAQAATLVPLIMQHEDEIPPERIIKLISKLSVLVPQRPAEEITEEEAFDADLDATLANREHGPVAQLQTESADPVRSENLPPEYAPDAPVCTKCGHRSTIVETAMFPHECPRCSALYDSPVPEDVFDAPKPKGKIIWRPTVLQFALLVLLTAAGAGLVAYQTGFLLPPTTPTIQPPAVTDDAANETVTAEPGATDLNATGATNRTADSPDRPEDMTVDASGESLAQNQTEALSVDNATNASASAAADEDGRNATAEQTPKQPADPAVQQQTEPEKEIREPEKKSRTATKQFDKGILTVSASRPITLWLVDQQTLKRSGPYQIDAGTSKEIVILKGSYHVIYVEDGRRKQTSMSFLSDTGYLDF